MKNLGQITEDDGGPEKGFNKKHDTLLFYAKSKEFQFNPDAIRISYTHTGGTGKAAAAGKKYPKVSHGKEWEWEPHPLGKVPEDVWEIPFINPQSHERSGFATQKPEALLERIIKASSNEGDLVRDCFIGSGTTIAVAQKLGRRWIGVDINKGALQITAKRIRKIVEEQMKEEKGLF